MEIVWKQIVKILELWHIFTMEDQTQFSWYLKHRIINFTKVWLMISFAVNKIDKHFIQLKNILHKHYMLI